MFSFHNNLPPNFFVGIIAIYTVPYSDSNVQDSRDGKRSKNSPLQVFRLHSILLFSLNESQYFYSLFYLLNVVNVNCFSAGGFKDRRKPPVYAAISIVLYLFKKHYPIFIIYNKAIRLSHHLYMLLFFVIMPLLKIPFLPYRYQVSP